MSTDFDDISKEIKTEFQKLLENVDDGYIISLKALYEWLEYDKFYIKYTTDSEYRKNYNSKTLRIKLDETKSEDDTTCDFIMRKYIDEEKNIDTNLPWFSVEGFKKFCMFTKSEKSKAVRKYFIAIEKAYSRALKQTKAENEKELDALEKDIKEFKSDKERFKLKLDAWREKHDKLLVKNWVLERNVEASDYLYKTLKNKEEYAYISTPEVNAKQYIWEITMKLAPLYIVRPDYVTKATLPKGSTLDINACNIDAIYENEFDQYNIHEVQDKSNPLNLYYYIGPINSVEKNKINYYKICDLHVKDPNHLKELKKRLDTDELDDFGKYMFKTPKKSIYKANYQQIYDLSLIILSDLHCDLIIRRHPERLLNQFPIL